jgi:hypothetical protein
VSARESLGAESFGLYRKTAVAVKRNAKTMKPAEYVWLKSQEFQPPIRRALVAEYERLHGGTHD